MMIVKCPFCSNKYYIPSISTFECTCGARPKFGYSELIWWDKELVSSFKEVENTCEISK